MRKLAIILLASTAVAVPAFAAPMNNPPPKQPQQQSQVQPSTQNAQRNRQQAENTAQNQSSQNQPQGQNGQRNNAQASYVKPSELNHGQVRKIQMSLNKDGFSAGHVDGIWGPQTGDAVRHFDQAKNIQGNGLTKKTLSDLGVQVASNQVNTNSNTENQARYPNQAPKETKSGRGQSRR